MTRATTSMLLSLGFMGCVAGATVYGWWLNTVHPIASTATLAGLTIIVAIVTVIGFGPDVVRGLKHIADEAAREID